MSMPRLYGDSLPKPIPQFCVAHQNSMGRTVLANQFVAGLRPELKTEVVGTEGNIEQLLVKARLEEAKQTELATVRTVSPPKKPIVSPSEATPPKSTSSSTSSSAVQLRASQK